MLVLVVGIGSYFLLNGSSESNAPTKAKVPTEEIKVGEDHKEANHNIEILFFLWYNCKYKQKKNSNLLKRLEM